MAGGIAPFEILARIHFNLQVAVCPAKIWSVLHTYHNYINPNSYSFHGQIAVASNRYTHTTWLVFWDSRSLVESNSCHYVMVEADSHLKLLSASTLDIYKLFEHIYMLSWA